MTWCCNTSRGKGEEFILFLAGKAFPSRRLRGPLPLLAGGVPATPLGCSAPRLAPERVLLLRCASSQNPLQHRAPLNGSLEKPRPADRHRRLSSDGRLAGAFQFAGMRGSLAEPLDDAPRRLGCQAPQDGWRARPHCRLRRFAALARKRCHASNSQRTFHGGLRSPILTARSCPRGLRRPSLAGWPLMRRVLCGRDDGCRISGPATGRSVKGFHRIQTSPAGRVPRSEPRWSLPGAAVRLTSLPVADGRWLRFFKAKNSFFKWRKK